MKNLFFGDWGTKITALLLSVIVWAALYSAEARELDLRPGLRLNVHESIPLASLRVRVGGELVAGWTYGESTERIGSVPLRVMGSGAAWDRVVEEFVLVVLDIRPEMLTGPRGEGVSVPLTAGMVRGLPVSIVAEWPTSQGMDIDYVTFRRRTLPIDTSDAAIGEPGAGYSVRVTAEPAQILADVPEGFEGSLRPQPVAVQGLTAGFRTPNWRLATPGVRHAEPFSLVVAIEATPEVRHQVMLPVKFVSDSRGPLRRWELGEQAQFDGRRYRIPVTLMGPGRLIHAADVEAKGWVVIEAPVELAPGVQVGVDDAWVRVLFDDADLRRQVSALPFGHEEESQRDITVSITALGE